MTPEGRIKKAVSDLLKSFAPIDIYMPVPGGFGESRLDYVVCYRGRYIAIETKAPGKKPTDRQQQCIARYERAGAKVFVIHDGAGVDKLAAYMAQLTLVGNLYESAGL